MIVPPRRPASSRPAPDFPLAVGPAIRTADRHGEARLRRPAPRRSGARPLSRRSAAAPISARFLHRGDPRTTSSGSLTRSWVTSTIIPRLHVLLGGGLFASTSVITTPSTLLPMRNWLRSSSVSGAMEGRAAPRDQARPPAPRCRGGLGFSVFSVSASGSSASPGSLPTVTVR